MYNGSFESGSYAFPTRGLALPRIPHELSGPLYNAVPEFHGDFRGAEMMQLNFAAYGSEEYLQPVSNEAGEPIIEVECGENRGLLYISRLCQGSKGPCILFQDSWLTPNEFQYVSGRETAKDWKRSIRHKGRSIKLLLNKGILTVHPSTCDCDGCRISSPVHKGRLGRQRPVYLSPYYNKPNGIAQYMRLKGTLSTLTGKGESKLVNIINHLRQARKRSTVLDERRGLLKKKGSVKEEINCDTHSAESESATKSEESPISIQQSEEDDIYLSDTEKARMLYNMSAPARMCNVSAHTQWLSHKELERPHSQPSASAANGIQISQPVKRLPENEAMELTNQTVPCHNNNAEKVPDEVRDEVPRSFLGANGKSLSNPTLHRLECRDDIKQSTPNLNGYDPTSNATNDQLHNPHFRNEYETAIELTTRTALLDKLRGCHIPKQTPRFHITQPTGEKSKIGNVAPLDLTINGTSTNRNPYPGVGITSSEGQKSSSVHNTLSTSVKFGDRGADRTVNLAMPLVNGQLSKRNFGNLQKESQTHSASNTFSSNFSSNNLHQGLKSHIQKEYLNSIIPKRSNEHPCMPRKLIAKSQPFLQYQEPMQSFNFMPPGVPHPSREMIKLPNEHLFNAPMTCKSICNIDVCGQNTANQTNSVELERHNNASQLSPQTLRKFETPKANHMELADGKPKCSVWPCRQKIQNAPGSQKDIKTWTTQEVTDFLASTKEWAPYIEYFKDQQIDGNSLCLLTVDLMVNTLGIKLGPALSLHSVIVQKSGQCVKCNHCLHCHNQLETKKSV